MLKNFETYLKILSDYDKNGIKKIEKENYIANLKKFAKNTISNKKIIVYGDYDADGILSSSMVYLFINKTRKTLGLKSENVDIEFSDRNSGFGLPYDKYKEFSKKYDYIIVTDTGSELEYLNNDIDNMLILDHHPAPKKADFVINPNINNDNPYITSGGDVVYDFLKHSKKLLSKVIEKEIYENIFNYKLNKTLKEFRAITLISDIALLNKTNREKIIDALNTIKLEPILPMFYTLYDLDNITSMDLSYGIISKINAYSRMGKNLQDVFRWILPASMEEFEKANKRIVENNKDKIRLVKKIYKSYLFNNNEDELFKNNIHILYINSDIHGINGLIANKIFMNFTKPALVMSNLNSKTIVGSARGEGVKEILSDAFKQLGYNTYGGHDEASGFTIKKEDLDKFVDIVNEIVNSKEITLKEIVFYNKNPVTLQDFLKIQKLYKDYSYGVNFFKSINQSVKDLKIEAIKEYKGGFGKVLVSDRNNPKITADFFVDLDIANLDMIEKGISIFELSPKELNYKITVEDKNYDKLAILPFMEDKLYIDNKDKYKKEEKILSNATEAKKKEDIEIKISNQRKKRNKFAI